MASANPQISSVSQDSDLRKRKEEEKEVDEEEDQEEEDQEEDEVEEVEDIGEEDDEVLKQQEEGEEVDTCVYDKYKPVEVSDDILSTVDTEEYRIYLEYAIKTEGFYVPFTPEDAFGVLCSADPRSRWWPMIAEGAQLALKHYNKKRAGPDGQLKLVSIRLVNVQSAGGVFFYITLAAKNVASGDIRDYQTKVFRGTNMKWKVLMFREDPEIVVEVMRWSKMTWQDWSPSFKSRMFIESLYSLCP